MKRYNQALFLFAILVLLVVSAGAVGHTSAVAITIGQRLVPSEFGPIMTESGFIVPLELTALFGAEVRRAGDEYEVTIGGKSARVRPIILSGSPYLVLRSFADQFGFKVTLNFEGNAIDISPWSTLGSPTTSIAAFQTIDDALQLIEKAREQLELDEAAESGSQPVRAALFVPESSPQSGADGREAAVDPARGGSGASGATSETGATGETVAGAADGVSGARAAGADRRDDGIDATSSGAMVGDHRVESTPSGAGDHRADDPSLAIAGDKPAEVASAGANLGDTRIDESLQSVEESAKGIAARIASLLGGGVSQTATERSGASESSGPGHPGAAVSEGPGALESGAAVEGAAAQANGGTRAGASIASPGSAQLSGGQPAATAETSGSSGSSEASEAVVWNELAEATGVRLEYRQGEGLRDVRLLADRDVTVTSSLLIEPYRLVVDVAEAAGVHLEPLVLNDPVVERIRVAEWDGALRLIFDLTVGVGHAVTQPHKDEALIRLYRPLSRIDVETGPAGGRIWLDLHPETPYNMHRLPAPDRVVIDFAETTMVAEERLFAPLTGPIAGVRAAQFLPDVSRLVLEVSAETEVEITPDRRGVRIDVGDRIPLLSYRTVGPHEVHLGLNIPSGAPIRIARLIAPDRVVIDLPGAHLEEASLEEIFLDGPLTRIRASQFDQDTVRVVADLRHHVQYGVRTEKGRTVVVLRQPDFAARRIVLDAGHGGIDGGAVGKNTGLTEKEVNLDITLRVAALIADGGGEAYLTRSDDTFIDLWSRPRMANDLSADVFVSIHANTALTPSPTANGTEVYVRTQEADSLLLGRLLLEGLVSALGTRDRGVRENRYLVVRNASMPAALVEVAFLSDAVEEELLAQDWFRQRAAEGIANGLLRYFHRDDELSADELNEEDELPSEWNAIVRGQP